VRSDVRLADVRHGALRSRVGGTIVRSDRSAPGLRAAMEWFRRQYRLFALPPQRTVGERPGYDALRCARVTAEAFSTARRSSMHHQLCRSRWSWQTSS